MTTSMIWLRCPSPQVDALWIVSIEKLKRKLGYLLVVVFFVFKTHLCSLLFAVSRPCLYNGMPAHFADSPQMEAIYKMLSVTQPPPSPEVLAKLYRPASVVDKAHIHSRYALQLWAYSLFMLGQTHDEQSVHPKNNKNKNKRSFFFSSQVAGLIPLPYAAGYPRKRQSLAALQILFLLWHRTKGLCVCMCVWVAPLCFLISSPCVWNFILVPLSVCAVWCCASDAAVRAGTLGHPAGGHWLHRGGDDAVWSSSGRKHCVIDVNALALNRGDKINSCWKTTIAITYWILNITAMNMHLFYSIITSVKHLWYICDF